MMTILILVPVLVAGLIFVRVCFGPTPQPEEPQLFMAWGDHEPDGKSSPSPS